MKFFRRRTKTSLFYGVQIGDEEVGLVVQDKEEEPTFQWVDVDSSMINSVGFAKGDGLLRVRFHNDTEYEYEGVLFSRFKDFAQAESVGGYFNLFIKDNYPTKLLEEV